MTLSEFRGRGEGARSLAPQSGTMRTTSPAIEATAQAHDRVDAGGRGRVLVAIPD